MHVLHACALAILHARTVGIGMHIAWPVHKCSSAMIHACTMDRVHACTTVHVRPLAIVHVCIVALWHACTMDIVHACPMALVHACTMFAWLLVCLLDRRSSSPILRITTRHERWRHVLPAFMPNLRIMLLCKCKRFIPPSACPPKKNPCAWMV